jgi:Homeodomain-like domain
VLLLASAFDYVSQRCTHRHRFLGSGPPRPDKVKIQGDVEQHLIRLACSDPPAGRCCWTLQLLADRLIALGCFPKVSRETVRQALKKTTSNLGS